MAFPSFVVFSVWFSMVMVISYAFARPHLPPHFVVSEFIAIFFFVCLMFLCCFYKLLSQIILGNEKKELFIYLLY